MKGQRRCSFVLRVAMARRALAVLLASVVVAAGADESGDPLVAFAAVPDKTLAEMRGGFVTENGLEINVGIERLVFVNDSLQSSFSMDLSNINRDALAGQFGTTADDYLQVVQQGMGNGVAADIQSLVDAGVLNVIQNALDGQKIGNITGLNIDVKNFNNIKMPELGRMMDFEVARSVGSVH